MPRRLVLIAAAVACAACRRGEVTHYQMPKSVESGSMNTAVERPRSDRAPAPPAPGAVALRWTLPKGWSESASSGMRYATLKPGAKGRIDISVIVLGGAAGGELANVNRWRGQIGLAPIDERALTAARNVVQSKAGAVTVYDFSSDGANKTRLVAGLLLTDESTWFVKMMGDESAVASARPDFLQLLRSLRLDAAN
jgi:hypothetical protein